MSLINDYTHLALTDQRERDIRSAGRAQQASPAGHERSSELVAQASGAPAGAHQHCDAAFVPAVVTSVEWRRPSTGSRTARDPVRRQSQVAR